MTPPAEQARSHETSDRPEASGSRLRLLGDEELSLVVTSLLVGLAAGVASIGFRWLIDRVGYLGYTVVPNLLAGQSRLSVVLAPMLGGLVVGWLVTSYAPEAKGHGVPEVMDAVARKGGRIRPVVVVVKALASSVSIGSGGSVGREGPIVQIGSAIGSSLGQWMRLSSERISNLVACGAAAGIASTFNAPIAGVIFAIEVILGGRFSVRYFSSVVIAAVAASVVGRVAFGDVPAFHIPFEYGLNSFWELALYPVLGVLAAVAAAAFVRVLYWSENLFDAWTFPAPLKPVVGGLLLGLLALAYPSVTGAQWERIPHVFNVGYDVIEQALANELSLQVLAALFVLKILATSLTLGSGGSGGVFAPSLFMGAMLGGAFALGADLLFPGLPAAPGAYALVGMAAVFAGAAHAPMTAILILFELTGDYRIMLPLMLTSVIATLVARQLLGGESIYSMKLSRRGVHLQGGREVDTLSRVRVAEVMNQDADSVPEGTPVRDLRDLFSRRRKTGLLVHDRGGRLAGIVTLTDLDRAESEGTDPGAPAAQIATPVESVQVARPDESMGAALARMGVRGLGRLPVVARDDDRRIVGVIRREDIIRAYQMGVARGGGPEAPAGQPRFVDADFIDVTLEADDAAVGRPVRDIAPSLPQASVLVAVDRGGDLVVPRGDTTLLAGDFVTALVRRQDAEALVRALREGALAPGRQEGAENPDGSGFSAPF